MRRTCFPMMDSLLFRVERSRTEKAKNRFATDVRVHSVRANERVIAGPTEDHGFLIRMIPLKLYHSHNGMMSSLFQDVKEHDEMAGSWMRRKP